MAASTMTVYTTTLRLPTVQARKIRALAKASDMSMAQWLRRAVTLQLLRELAPGDRELQREKAMEARK